MHSIFTVLGCLLKGVVNQIYVRGKRFTREIKVGQKFNIGQNFEDLNHEANK